jgi:hypothetical protein
MLLKLHRFHEGRVAKNLERGSRDLFDVAYYHCTPLDILRKTHAKYQDCNSSIDPSAVLTRMHSVGRHEKTIGKMSSQGHDKSWSWVLSYRLSEWNEENHEHFMSQYSVLRPRLEPGAS